MNDAPVVHLHRGVAMLRRRSILALLIVPAVAIVGARARQRPSSPPLTPAPAHVAHAGHGAPNPGNSIDWGTISDRDLDVATVFLTARDHGVAPALDRLRTLVAHDSTLAPMGHVVAHALGRYAVAHASDDPRVFAACREDFQAGCWHGVMEGYFTSRRAAPASAVTPAALGALCPTIVPAEPARLPLLECAHGMGHGLTARARNDYRAALRACDALPTDDVRGECRDGVFMEVTVRGTEPRPGANDATLLRRTDLRWPCPNVDAAYQPSCWAYQPIVIYEFTNDLARTVATCRQAPASAIEACHRGFGKQTTGWLRRDSLVLAACALGEARFLGACVAGAAEGYIDETWTSTHALALCRRASPAAKPACYTMVGARMTLIHPRDTDLAHDCATAEPAFVATCRAGARQDGPA